MKRHRTIGLAASLALLLGLSACAVRYQRRWNPLPQPPKVFEVFYATDRAVTDPAGITCKNSQTKLDAPLYGNARADDGQLRYGVFPIQVPAERKIGELVRYVRRTICLKGATHKLFLTGPTPQPEEEFWNAIQEKFPAAGPRRILVFVHGYYYDFDEAALWAAQFRQDLEFEGPQVLYSWPSARGRLRYVADRTSVDWSTPHLTAFLKELAARFAGAEIDLVAHSMGSQALFDALRQIAAEPRGASAPRFAQVVLAAPDIDTWILRDRIQPVLPLARRFTFYVSTRDRALGAAARLHGYPRAGDLEFDPALLRGIDIVDVTKVDRSRSGHNYFFDNRAVLTDLAELLRNATPPEKRFGLVRVTTDSGMLWQFRK